jgi:hypothetical protein
MKRLIGLFALLLLSPAHADDTAKADAAKKIVVCMRANFPPSMRIQGIELTTRTANGEARTLKGRVFMNQETTASGASLLRAMLRVDEPMNLKGAAYLVRETDDFLRDGMFVYLPAVGRVRRVTGTFADASLMGTEFSYYDFKQLQSAFGDLTAEVSGEGDIEGRPVHQLHFKALPDVETRYTSVHTWVDQKTCVLLRADFFEGDKVVKRMTASPRALQQSGNFWYLSELSMQSLPGGALSTLKMKEVTSGGQLPAVYFNPQSFYLAN